MGQGERRPAEARVFREFLQGVLRPAWVREAGLEARGGLLEAAEGQPWPSLSLQSSLFFPKDNC